MDIIFLIILVIIGYISGSIVEKRHLTSLREREREAMHLPLVTNEMKEQMTDVESVELVSGSVVIGSDYFKQFVYSLRNIFGGNVRTLETVMDRARREAMLRMRAQAPGADYITKMRMETTTIGPRQVEAYAYGTAIYMRKA